MKSIILLMLCLVLTDAEHKDRFRRFVGGSEAQDGQFPYYVSIRYPFKYRHICGGSIVHEKYVLAAAHCFANIERKYLTVVAGSADVRNVNHTYSIEDIIFHPDYKSNSKLNDLALVKITSKFEFSNHIQSIPIARKYNYSEGTTMSICGYGRQSFFNLASLTLQYSNVTTIELQKCQKHLSPSIVTDIYICTYDLFKGLCKGDSGSPLVYKGELVAMGSWMVGLCSYTYPDVYTKIAPFADWLNQYLTTENNDIDHYSVILIP